MSRSVSIEIALPVLNEEAVLEAAVRKVSSFALRRLAGKNVSLVIADNGSSDNTFEIGRALAQEMPNLRVVSVDRPGVGLALKAAWSTSTSDYVGFMDIDLATDIEHLGDVCDLLEDDFDIVVGSRLLAQSDVRNRKFSREILSRIFNAYIRWRTGLATSDAMCGFKFMSKEAFRSVHEGGARSDGWIFSAEILLTGHVLDLRVAEIPVKWVDDRRSKVRLLRHSMEFIRGLEIYQQRIHRA